MLNCFWKSFFEYENGKTNLGSKDHRKSDKEKGRAIRPFFDILFSYIHVIIQGQCRREECKMILEQLDKQMNFTSTEQLIATYILEHLDEVIKLSARKLGEKSYTSKASVIRFCQKLNLSGYEEFKSQLEVEVIERNRMNLLLEKEPVHKETTLEEIFTIIPNLYNNTMSNVNLNMNEVSFRRIISQIRKASTVDIYGAGVTYTCATTAKFKFRTLGINCNTYSGINEHYIRSTEKQRNRLAIVLSFTGANKAMVDIANYLKASGIFLVGIGGDESTHLREICDEYIELTTQEYILSMEVTHQFIAMTYIFDLLFTTLLVADFDNNAKAAMDVIQFKKEVWKKTE